MLLRVEEEAKLLDNRDFMRVLERFLRFEKIEKFGKYVRVVNDLSVCVFDKK